MIPQIQLWGFCLIHPIVQICATDSPLHLTVLDLSSQSVHQRSYITLSREIHVSDFSAVNMFRNHKVVLQYRTAIHCEDWAKCAEMQDKNRLE